MLRVEHVLHCPQSECSSFFLFSPLPSPFPLSITQPTRISTHTHTYIHTRTHITHAHIHTSTRTRTHTSTRTRAPQVGSTEVTPPSVNQLHAGLSITKTSAGYVILETSCGLRVAFNGKSTETAGTVTVPPRYADKVYGMCGDCDGLQVTSLFSCISISA